jgi:hypothetical protein
MNDVSMNDKLTYLSRAFDRMRNEAVQSVQRERTRVMAQAAQQGALQSGRMMLLVKEEYDRLASETADKIVKLAFEATESTAHPVCEVVNKGLIALRDALSNDLTEFLRVQCSWAPANASNQIKSDFLTATDARIAGMVDDLSHGIAGGTRLNKDPLVSVISQITNSPGAVSQSGIGNIQHARASANSHIRSALAQFMQSKEVQTLSLDNKQSIADVAEVLVIELDKAEPDSSKIGRWGKRLVDIAERLGIGVAASGLSHVLFG